MLKEKSRNLMKMLASTDKCACLVGANAEGRNFYKKMTDSLQGERIGIWIDKKYNFFKLCGLNILPPKEIPHCRFDCIIVAGGFNKRFAEDLINEYSLTKLPCYCIEKDADEEMVDFEYPNIHYTDEKVSEDELEYINPIELVNENRLDIVIRYIAAKEILNREASCGVQMYKLLSLSMNDGEEFTRPFTTCAYFSAYESKKGFETFYNEFIKLSDSMKRNGFLMNHFIPISEKGGVINGSHRLAMAMALGKKVYIKRYIGFGEPFMKFDKDDLARIGCTDKQIQLVLMTYNKLKYQN